MILIRTLFLSSCVAASRLAINLTRDSLHKAQQEYDIIVRQTVDRVIATKLTRRREKLSDGQARELAREYINRRWGRFTELHKPRETVIAFKNQLGAFMLQQKDPSWNVPRTGGLVTKMRFIPMMISRKKDTPRKIVQPALRVGYSRSKHVVEQIGFLLILQDGAEKLIPVNPKEFRIKDRRQDAKFKSGEPLFKFQYPANPKNGCFYITPVDAERAREMWAELKSMGFQTKEERKAIERQRERKRKDEDRRRKIDRIENSGL